jgi:hypothetical protein
MCSASSTWPSWKPIVSAYLRRVRADADAAAVARGFDLGEGSISGGDAGQLEHFKPTYDRVVQACADAQAYVGRHGTPVDWFSGSLANAAFMGFHAADVELVDLLTDDQIRGKAPLVLALAKAYLPADDPQRTAFESRWQPPAAANPGSVQQPEAAPPSGRSPAPAQGPARKRRRCLRRRRKPPVTAAKPPAEPQGVAVVPVAPPAPVPASVVTPADRAQFAATLGIIYLFLDLAQMRVRQFRSVLVGTTTFLAVLLIGLATVGGLAPKAIGMCGPGPATNVTAPTSPSATPTPSPSPSSTTHAGVGSSGPGTNTTVVVPPQVCASGDTHPTRPDVLLVVAFGLAGGAVSAAISLSGLGVSLAGTRYSLSVAQAALKVALGGMFGFLGIIFLQAGLVTFLQLKSQAQILSYAFIFGYSQQLLTRLIDKQATSLTSDASPTTPAPATGSSASK